MGIRSAGDAMVDLTDHRLFGNDAGDDEDLALLNHYFLERPEFRRFYDSTNTFRVVRARKGTGKSTLLRRTVSLGQESLPNDLFVTCTGSEITPDFSIASNAANPVLAWQKANCGRVNREIGSRIKWAFDDTSIMLVEAAEIDSFRGRNFISALADRLLGKLTLGPAGLERTKPLIGNEIQLLRKASQNETESVWLVVDDIDATFKNNAGNRAYLAAFFSACRDLAQKVNGLVIRAAVRTDVWTLLRASDEALDKCDQYVFNLRWSLDEVGYILLSKADAYFHLIKPELFPNPSKNEEVRKEQAFLKIFPHRYPWGRDDQIPPQKYLAFYSQGRPRWTAKLCRAAADKSIRRGHLKVEESDVKSVLAAFSAQRRLDLVGEHNFEYPDFNGLLQVFSGWKKKFTTQEMLSRISADHIRKATVGEVDPKMKDAVNLAHLLFRSGAIGAVSAGKGRPEHFEYEDRPTLLASRANLDEGNDWEIPMFLRPDFHL